MNGPLEYVRDLKKRCHLSGKGNICISCAIKLKTAVKMCEISQKKFLGLLDYPLPEAYEKRIMVIIKEFSEAIKEGREELGK